MDCLPQIEHIVILMMENHSYDNYFGMLTDRGDGFTLDENRLPTASNKAGNGEPDQQIWLYDEHGGYYDHVPPPPAPEPDDVPGRSPMQRFFLLRLLLRFAGYASQIEAADAGPSSYDRLGFRVPAVIASPYAKPGHVTDTVYDHTSILKLIERKWNLPPLTRRDAAATHLLKHLGCLPAIAHADLRAKIPASADHDEFSAKLTDLNLKILEALTASPPDTLLAYQLGRSLRDTVNPPLEQAPGATTPAPALARQFRRDRIAKLQEWLATLARQLPPHAAAVVATSLGRWSEFAAVTIGTNSKLRGGDRTGVQTAMCRYLLPQGNTWLMLLTGARPTAGLLSPEAYVAAAEEALRRSARSIRQVLQHYWFAVVIALAALGGVLYLAISSLGGAAKVWTSIAAVGISLGVLANSIASTTRRLAAEAEQPVFAMAEEDAMAWAVTTLPPEVNLGYRGVRQLRRAGVAPASTLGRV